jgi:hypothetical protein
MNTDPRKSAQPCGCDEGAAHLCERHREEFFQDMSPTQNLTRPTNPKSSLPSDPKDRKTYPIVTGVLDYFPDAIAEVAHVSFIGNEQHNPGQPLHWDRSKSTDQADTIGRHLIQRGTRDSDGQRHSAKVAWRALALLQLEIEEDRK